MGEAGQPYQAAEQFRDLLNDHLQALVYDPGTLAARSNLADWLGVAGLPADAAEQYRSLFDDCLRVSDLIILKLCPAGIRWPTGQRLARQ